MVKSATRTLDLLELLAGAPGGLSHGDIAGALDIPRSSVTALLASLIERDFVEFDEARRQYHLGHAVLKLGRAYLGRLDLVGRARPLMTRLSDELGEACALTIRRADDVIVVWKIDDPDPHRPSLSMQLGQSGPVFASASGKAMLAAEGPAAVEAYLAGVDLGRRTAGATLDRESLRADLEQTLGSGIGFSRGEMFAQIIAVGVAVAGPTGAPVAGLSVSFSHDRLSDAHVARVVAALRKTAAALSVRLGAAA